MLQVLKINITFAHTQKQLEQPKLVARLLPFIASKHQVTGMLYHKNYKIYDNKKKNEKKKTRQE